MDRVSYHPTQLPPAVRKQVCNGMGPRGGLLFKVLIWFLKWLGPGKVFELAADRHDMGYALGGTEEHRMLCDNLFMMDMAEAYKPYTGRKRRWLRAVAHWAHSAVDEYGDEKLSGGESPFKYRDKPLTVEELIALHTKE